MERRDEIDHILHNIHSINHVFMSNLHDIGKKHGITMTQGFVMKLISKKKPTTTIDIAKHLGISMSAATQIVDGLIKSNLVIKSVNDNDKRISNIELSPVSKQKISNLKRQTASNMIDFFDTLSDDEIYDFITITDKLLANQKDKK